MRRISQWEEADFAERASVISGLAHGVYGSGREGVRSLGCVGEGLRVRVCASIDVEGKQRVCVRGRSGVVAPWPPASPWEGIKPFIPLSLPSTPPPTGHCC